jgi:hypothetical protein
MQKIAENFIKKKTNCEAIFIPWNEKQEEQKKQKPIFIKNLIKNPKKEDSNTFSDYDFNDINEYVKEKNFNENHKLFIAAIGSERIALDHYYLTAKKFVRVKLPNIGIQFKSKSLNQLGKMDAEVHILIHKTGIIIVTLYIHPPSGKTLNTFQIIEIERVLSEDEDIKINDCSKDGLRKYLLCILEKLFLKELENVGISVAIKKLKKRGYLKKEVRFVVCIRKCYYDINFKHMISKEFYGILNSMRGWYMLDEREVKIKELYKRRDFHIFVGNSGYLFCGFDEFEKRIEENSNIFGKNGIFGEIHFLYTFPEYFEHYVVTPMEFISIIDSILERCLNKIQEVSGNVSRHYLKATKLVGEWFDVNQECNNITFMRARPIWRIVRNGEKSLGISEKIKATETNISTLTGVTQQDAVIRITIAFVIISIMLGVLSLAATNSLWVTITVFTFNIPIWIAFILLLLLGIKVAGIRVTVSMFKNAIFSFGDIRELIDDLCLFLKTIKEIKFKDINKRS